MTLVADSISKSFAGRRVLTSARLRAEHGRVAGLLGRMGSGKSTLLKICAGLIQAESGWIELNGRKYLRTRRSTLAAQGVFYIGEADNLAWTLTVHEHFNEIERRYGLAERDEIFELLDLKPLLQRKGHALSGGEVKRVEIGLAFARRPSCVLLDEPFRSADPLLCERLGHCFRLLASHGCAVVVSGHEVNQLLPFLDSITWVTSGTTHLLGSVESALAHEAFTREYLGLSVRRDSKSALDSDITS